MTQPIAFTEADFDNVELVRQIVLRRLREGDWYYLNDSWDDNRVAKFVSFPRHDSRKRFVVLALEVLWQLISQGVITPGKDSANLELPWFRVTSYGKTVLEEERFLPHDPTGYLVEISKVSKSAIGKASTTYLEEALRCFTSGCSVASVLMLGIAAEAVFLGLCEVIAKNLSDPKERAAFDKLQWVRPKHRWVVAKFQNLPTDARKKLPESLDVTLTSLYDLIRRQRNDIGHPNAKVATIGRESAFVYFRLFPTFIQDVEAFAGYCTKHGL